MRGAGTLIPARFLALVAHLCVLITLTWESHQSVQHCLPSHHQNYFQIHHNRLVAGYAAAITLILLELISFLFGLTMFSPTVSLISTGSHCAGAIALTYFIVDGWHCDWYWPLFSLCSLLPSLLDIATAALTLCTKKM